MKFSFISMILELKNRLDMFHNFVTKNGKLKNTQKPNSLKIATLLLNSGNFSAAKQLTEFHG